MSDQEIPRTAESLGALSVRELRAVAAADGIAGSAALTKADLIAAILAVPLDPSKDGDSTPPAPTPSVQNPGDPKPGGPDAGVPIGFFAGTFLRLRNMARSLGVGRDVSLLRAPLESAVAIASAGDVEAVPVAWIYKSDYVGEGPVEAVDPDGNWGAVVFNDGRCELTKYVSPNLHNRAVGQSVAGDITLFIDSITDFSGRVHSLLVDSEQIIEASLSEVAADEAARLEAASAPAPEPEVQTEPTPPELIAAAAAEFGFTSLPPDTWPYKVAEAIGVDTHHPKLDSEGNPARDAVGRIAPGELLSFDEIVAAVTAKLQS